MLQPALGKREIWISLQTHETKVALERVKAASLEIDRIFAEARGIEPTINITGTSALWHPLQRAAVHSHHAHTFAQLAERFMNLPEKQALGDKTKLEYRITFRLFTTLIGEDTPITRISRANCRRIQETLAHLPPNSAKRFPDTHPAKVVEIAKRDGLAPMTPKTANNLLTRLCAILGWAHREGWITSNPAQGLYLPENVHDKEKRHPFTIEQLNGIFSSKPMIASRSEGSPQWWIPILALWTGARLNELCQLLTTDITERGGKFCILIRSGDGKRLKTANAHRVIPIHPKLVELGFLEYVESKRQGESMLLFPDLRGHACNRASDQFSKHFGFFLRDIGVKTDKTCFHSFRHCFRDALREAGIQRELVQALGGWQKLSGTEDIYGGGFSTATLHNAIRKVEYAGLVL